MGLAIAPVALAALAADAVIGKFNKPELIAIINKIKIKYKISDNEVFITDSEKCSVKLSEEYPCKVFIDGDFIVGETINKCKIEMTFSEFPRAVEKIFSKGNFPVSFSR